MNDSTRNSFNPLKLLSLLLLIPLGIILFGYALTPALDTFDLSTQDYDILQDEGEDVGNENYERMFEHRPFIEAVEFTSQMIGTRVFIVAVLPALVGVLIGVQGWATRGLNRLLLTLVGVCLSPVAIAVIWLYFLGLIWDNDPMTLNPLEIPESLMLGTPDGAPNNLILLDSMLTMGASLAVISLFYIAAIRGKRLGGQPALAGLAVWLISILVTLIGFSGIFELPRIVTNGGPISSTTPLSLYSFNMAFRNLNLGYGAAIATLTIIATLLLACMVWFLLTAFNLRLRYTAPGQAFTKGSWASLGSIPLILAAGLPVVLLVLWGVSFVQRNGGFDPVLDQLARDQLLDNTINSPWFTIWFIQIPFAYLATLALGFWRPLGRIGSSLLFLPLLVLAFLPTEALAVSWFISAREAGILNSQDVQMYPWFLGPFSLILFKMYFDGAHEAYQEARAQGKQTGEAFIMRVFLPSLPIVLLVGGVLSFLSVQEFYWSYISNNDPSKHPISMFTISMLSNFSGGADARVGVVAVYFLLYFAIPFGIFFSLMQLFVVDRLALIAGKTQLVVEAPIVLQSTFTDAPANPPEILEAERPIS